MPTETSYGLCCDATDQTAVDKIFKIKNRDNKKPLLVVVDSVDGAKKYLEWGELLGNLAKKYWDDDQARPLTIVGKYQFPITLSKTTLVSGVVSKDNTLAVRVTKHSLLKQLCQKLGHPIVATSANISDAVEIYDSEEIKKSFAGREYFPDILVDAGLLPINSPSTIISVVENKVTMLRQGEVKISV